ncbi:hypothetical protein QQ045_004345 [Rhodiola kirilowii]
MEILLLTYTTSTVRLVAHQQAVPKALAPLVVPFPHPAVHTSQFLATKTSSYGPSEYDMMNDVQDDSFGNVAHEKYRTLLTEAQQTVLELILKGMQTKVECRWSDKSFTTYLEGIKDAIPPDNNCPRSYREVKKIMKNLGLDYQTIHACEYGCVLYYQQHTDREHCPKCHEPRYANSECGSKCLYMSPYIAEEMRWHAEKRGKEGDNDLIHPEDGEAWENFKKEFLEFAHEIHNVRLGLSTDGLNPFGVSGLSHSTWPIIVRPYNFPPWMCMKKEFNILVMLISGPKSPRKCLNVFMRPLIDKLKMLWNTGVATFDRFFGSSFNMKVTVISTISDFPGLGMLGGLKTKRFKARGNTEKLCWTHKSIFYELPYWSTFIQPYSLDVMHIEKNVFDNIIGTILALEGKTKDDHKARAGLKEQGLRKHQWDKFKGLSSKREKVTQAPYTVLPEHKVEILEMIKDVKYPYGYAWSLRSKINLHDKQVNGLKTHDCHVMLQRVLPVVIRPYLPYCVESPLISLSHWFQKLCCRELMRGDVMQMKEDIVKILCSLERIFPPAFFTIMVHLLVHLPEQILLKGPMATMQGTGHPRYNPMLHYLSCQPQAHTCYSQCDVNGVKFVTEERDRKLKTQNCGVMVQTEGDVTYYGVLEEVVSLRYAEGMSVIVFKCRWFNTDPTKRGNIKIDHGLISVDTSTSWYEDSPFCLTSNARQIFYIDDPKAGDNWKVVNSISHRGTYKCSSVAHVEDDVHSSLLSREDNAYQERAPSNLLQEDDEEGYEEQDDCEYEEEDEYEYEEDDVDDHEDIELLDEKDDYSNEEDDADEDQW